ncbi:MAG: hypothetical protein M1499_04510 [Firmicutes bacterium]|nr:hypothetical protein [Bacillota bacterium]
MTYLVMTYLGLIAVAISGAFVFFGFALFGPSRRRSGSAMVMFPRGGLPLRWVSLHVLLATVTLVLFTLAMIQGHFR